MSPRPELGSGDMWQWGHGQASVRRERKRLCPKSHLKGLQTAMRRFADIHRNNDAKQELYISPTHLCPSSHLGAKDISLPTHRPQNRKWKPCAMVTVTQASIQLHTGH
ncbi:uncharacterized protein LOC127423941 isoform X2 [Myxocyprinus asiaticus]|uniref:uncharacterized protein LOC127423941 isoform X2 n=1 Tax=Myxocyprinus asiaticus TaxID=70543 RepID=UPI00222208BF|nr:uncharacterized protein LOC127423941 isoform X2 [Myxocyprinus asiaticus]